MVLLNINYILTTNSYGCDDMCPEIFDKAIKMQPKHQEQLKFERYLLQNPADNLFNVPGQ